MLDDQLKEANIYENIVCRFCADSNETYIFWDKSQHMCKAGEHTDLAKGYKTATVAYPFLLNYFLNFFQWQALILVVNSSRLQSMTADPTLSRQLKKQSVLITEFTLRSWFIKTHCSSRIFKNKKLQIRPLNGTYNVRQCHVWNTTSIWNCRFHINLLSLHFIVLRSYFEFSFIRHST